MQYLISVIISVYNIEKYIAQCVESVLNQTFTPFEILLVNDGSSDNSLKVCSQYEANYPNLVKVINKNNGGLSSARNTGILKSRGGYCYFLDGDDYIHRDTLKSFVEILDKYGELDFAHGRMSYFYDEDEEPNYRVQPYFIDNSWEDSICDGQDAFVNAYKKQGVLQMGVRGLYNREFLLKNKLFFVEKSIPWGEDEEWTPRIFFVAKRCAGSDKPYYFYRDKRIGSETSKMGNVNTANAMIETYMGWKDLVGNNDCKDSFAQTLLNEAGRRYVRCLIKYSRCLLYQDLRTFLKNASRNKTLLKNAKLSGRSALARMYFQILGIRIGGYGIFLANKIIKR